MAENDQANWFLKSFSILEYIFGFEKCESFTNIYF